MSLPDGVQAHPALLPFLTDLVGKDVIVETVDGSQFAGLFAGGEVESDLQVGLSWVYKVTDKNRKNILPLKKDTLEKMKFEFSEVVSITSFATEEKSVKGFATDRDYHDKANGHHDEELEMWECDDEGEEIEAVGHMPDQKQRYQKNGGWSVDEMFNTNSQLGVQSTFIEDMSQYTTVEVEGDEEARARAEKIAREIENNSSSKYYSRLENDDDERDLDKITGEEEFEPHGRKGQRNNYNNNRNGGRGGASLNRRAEGLKSNERRGSGQQQRYNQGGPYNQRNQYVPNQGRRNDDYGGEWNAPKDQRKDVGPKVFENTHYKGGKVLLEQKPANQRPYEANRISEDNSRVRGLKKFQEDFTNTYNPKKSDEKEPIPQQSPSRPQAGSAWNRGPPSSLLNSQSVSSSSATPTHSSPTPAEAHSVDQVVEEVAHMCVAKDISKDSGHHSNENQDDSTGDKSDDKSDVNTSGSISGKKFSFNPNAAVFTPRQNPPTTPTQVVPVQAQMPVGVPMGSVPTAVPMQGVPPPGMVMPGPVVWQAPFPQAVPAGYQMFVPQQQMMGGPVPMNGPQRGSGPVTQGYGNQQNPRRNGPNQPGAAMVVPNGQWTNQMVVPQVGYYQSYAMGPAGGNQPQQFAGNPQLVAQGQQGIPPQMYQQQRYPGGQMGYMVPPGVPQQQRFPTPQGAQHGAEANGQFQQGAAPVPNPEAMAASGPPQSSANSTGPNSQPPTPGPQQPPPVASPAQLSHSAGGRGSPAPPPAQQFAQGPPPSSQQHISQAAYYQAQANMYMYGQQPGVIMYTGTGSMPMPGHVHPEGQQHIHHMEGMQGHQQYAPHEQYGGYIPAGGPGYQYQQQHPQQPMSRQNSIPQAAYNAGQGAPPPGMQPQGSVAPPPGSQPPASSTPQQQ